MRVAVAQIAPVLLDKRATLAKVEQRVNESAEKGAKLVVFGEATVPGYPWWVDRTDGAKFDDDANKMLFAKYAAEAVVLPDVASASQLDDQRNDLASLCGLASSHKLTIVIGVIERVGHSLYCSAVTIDATGSIVNVHRKLMPTFEERLVWATGDGHGLRVSQVGEFTMGVLNCWENWMPLARTALYAQGENLHVSLWPGCLRNTQDHTRFVSFESRSFVVAACNLMSKEILQSAPEFVGKVAMLAEMEKRGEDWIADGGSCIALPGGVFLVEPVVKKECLIIADLDIVRVFGERQNLDVCGHYGRPDVLSLSVNRQRLSAAKIQD
ncbi:Nitrilase/cyanide hydratase and apolipo protein N-acyltransferase [Chytriomyces sp. MP71]|nr:Nitrilase/cyanide hydratase and apolipo protein N-acyltransferase [Chytriomyces sp. MP71]